ncbi:unnamed protein product [Didymodactylos carnosus]|uniref:Uncharacterized protein n=1 Tax=Didymodactylos carnosus TaxID=1234261 RepID=A0A814E8Y9_9BILA|nr:unnamed protein product [Didymodactylos carnosus]CAF0966194.1 unnamed protein product [Didymodactylos carnosus]CAF3564433.1 unnamed protein product [Didymodactylos carnosus]CAF3739721.1 unnamed protein product [Didymodactylos carnosus]
MKPQSKSNIYQIPCECGATNVGETKVGFHQRMIQHEKLIEQDDDNSKSEMVQHHHQKGWQCMLDTEKAFIIEDEIDRRKRRIKESIYSTVSQSINRRNEIEKLWTPLLYEVEPSIKGIISSRERNFSDKRSVQRQDGDSGTAEEEED